MKRLILALVILAAAVAQLFDIVPSVHASPSCGGSWPEQTSVQLTPIVVARGGSVQYSYSHNWAGSFSCASSPCQVIPDEVLEYEQDINDHSLLVFIQAVGSDIQLDSRSASRGKEAPPGYPFNIQGAFTMPDSIPDGTYAVRFETTTNSSAYCGASLLGTSFKGPSDSFSQLTVSGDAYPSAVLPEELPSTGVNSGVAWLLALPAIGVFLVLRLMSKRLS